MGFQVKIIVNWAQLDFFVKNPISMQVARESQMTVKWV